MTSPTLQRAKPHPGVKPLSFQISAWQHQGQEPFLVQPKAYALDLPLRQAGFLRDVPYALSGDRQPRHAARVCIRVGIPPRGIGRDPQSLATKCVDQATKSGVPNRGGQEVRPVGPCWHTEVGSAVPRHQGRRCGEADLLADGVQGLVFASDFHNVKYSTQFLCYDDPMTKKQYEIPTPEELVALRARLQLTQTQFADYVRVSMRSVQQWEAGVHDMPPGLWELARIKEQINAGR